MSKKNPAPKTPNPVAPAKKTVAKKTTKKPVPAPAPDVAPSDEPKRLIPKAEPAQQPDEPKRLMPKAEPVQQAPVSAQTTPQRPSRNPEQQARWDAWQASKAQPWSKQGMETRKQQLAKMSPTDREIEKEKSAKRVGFAPDRRLGEPGRRGIGDRLRSAWKAFSAPKQDTDRDYGSVFAEAQKLMEQLVVIEQALHEYGINESSLTTEQYTRLSERKHLIRKELAEQIIREELYMHNVTLAELSEQEKTALVNTVKSRCDEMWSSLNEYVQEQNNGFDDFDIGPQSDEEKMEYQDKPDEYVDTPEFDAHLASVNAKNSNNNLEEKLQHTKTGEEHGVETHTLSKDGKPVGWAKKKGGVVVGKLSGKNTQK